MYHHDENSPAGGCCGGHGHGHADADAVAAAQGGCGCHGGQQHLDAPAVAAAGTGPQGGCECGEKCECGPGCQCGPQCSCHGGAGKPAETTEVTEPASVDPTRVADGQ